MGLKNYLWLPFDAKEESNDDFLVGSTSFALDLHVKGVGYCVACEGPGVGSCVACEGRGVGSCATCEGRPLDIYLKIWTLAHLDHQSNGPIHLHLACNHCL